MQIHKRRIFTPVYVNTGHSLGAFLNTTSIKREKIINFVATCQENVFCRVVSEPTTNFSPKSYWFSKSEPVGAL